MTPEQRQEVIRLLEQREDLSPEWARILFPPEKREYELAYYGKEREEDIFANTLAVPLQPVRTFGGNGENAGEWRNMLIFGDNLQVMKSLLEMKKAGKLCNADGTSGVRLVYIDPPFATKQEFQGGQAERAYQDKIDGSTFIEFIRKRCILLRELLSDDGMLFLHIDWRKGDYLRVILDEIFGEHKFRNELVWKRTGARSGSSTFNHIHDSILLYSRTDAWHWDRQYTNYEADYLEEFFKDSDETGKRFQSVILTAAGTRRGTSGMPWRGVNPTTKGRHWAIPGFIRPLLSASMVNDVRSALDELDSMGRILWPAKKGGIPRFKQYEDDRLGVELQSIWTDIRPVGPQSSERTGYPTQKPEALVDRLILTTTTGGDLVLDAFAGSGTTCAVAEKLGRRWIGIDCGKLAIYTMQKRMLDLHKEIGNKGPRLEAKPFTLFNAGLYDFSKLKELPWDSWRFFALQLFQCRDEPHTIAGIRLDGYLKGSSVLVFNHMKQKGARIDEETIASLQEALGTRVGSRLYIIAPALTFDFQQDYIALGGVRYYALRIPYSIINELHHREFTALKQPSDEMAVNDTVDAVGFDFIRTPELQIECGLVQGEGDATIGFIRIKAFKSEVLVRESLRKRGNRETLSMVMLDYDFDDRAPLFDLDAVLYASELEKEDWTLRVPLEALGQKLMAVFIDIYGNEARELISADQFKPSVDVKDKRDTATPKKHTTKKVKA